MNVLVLGANGRVGSKVAAELLQKGHTVSAGIHRNKDQVPSGASITSIDISDQASIENALANIEVVVCALSSWESKTHDVMSSAMRTVIPAMDTVGVKRIISISGDVARVPGVKTPFLVRLFHIIALGPIRSVIHDSEAHLRQLTVSDLDWTVLRPGIMSSSTKAAYKLQDSHPLSPFIPRVAVVAAIVDLVDTGEHIREAPYIASV